MERFRILRATMAFLLTPAFAQQTNPGHITVKVKLTHNRIVIPGKINGSPLTFLLDSACTIPTLHPDVVDELKLEPSGGVNIAGIAGEERAPTYRGVVFEMGEA